MTETVGPVLVGSAEGRRVAETIQRANPGSELIDRGSYLRVRARSPCAIDRASLSEAWGRDFALPGDLERLMTSFAGTLVIEADGVRWE